jgi:hypothetical protein
MPPQHTGMYRYCVYGFQHLQMWPQLVPAGGQPSESSMIKGLRQGLKSCPPLGVLNSRIWGCCCPIARGFECWRVISRRQRRDYQMVSEWRRFALTRHSVQTGRDTGTVRPAGIVRLRSETSGGPCSGGQRRWRGVTTVYHQAMAHHRPTQHQMLRTLNCASKVCM